MSSPSRLLSASFGVQVSVSECAAFLLIIDLYVDMEYFYKNIFWCSYPCFAGKET